jgi:hypothetical protein
LYHTRYNPCVQTAGYFVCIGALALTGALSNGSVIIDNSVFQSNAAIREGSAVTITNFNGTFENCSFDSNTASRGTLAWLDESTLPQYVAIANSTFTSNTAKSGSALRIVDSTNGNSQTTVTNCQFQQNLAATTGGSILIENSAVVTATVLNFSNGTAQNGGSVYVGATAALNMSDSVCTYSSAADGGCILIEGTASLQNVSLQYNAASSAGGAVRVNAKGIAVLDDCALTYNTAIEGGAISIQQGAKLTVSNTSIRDNLAVQAGAAIMQSGTLAFIQLPTIDSASILTNNTAGCCYAEGYGLAVATTDYCGSIDSGNDRQCCVAGEYADNGICHACDSSFTCTQLGIDTVAMPLVAGYWRENVTQTFTRECWNRGACIGGAAVSGNTNDYCATGYQGPCKYRTDPFIAISY